MTASARLPRPWRGWTARLALALGLFAMALAPHAQSATAAQATEQQIKAAFLFKFGGYVDWPAEAFERPDSPVNIGVVGSDVIADELGQTASKRPLNGRPVAVFRLARGELPASLHVLFVARSERDHLAEIQSALRRQPVLVVTEDEQSFDGGSMVNFVVEDGKVRFDVALAPAESASLKISARLLSVARKVIGRPAS